MKNSNATILDAATDPAIEPKVRSFLAELNKDSSPFWELPGDQVRSILTGLQNQTPVDVSGITIEEKTISPEGNPILLYIVRPEGVSDKLPVLLFIHGGVWKAGNFENHKRLVRDLVVGAQVAAVFVEYTPIPEAIYPTQINEVYAAAKWVVNNGDEINVDGKRMAVAGNSVGGNMSAAMALMVKHMGEFDLLFQVLLYPAVGADFETESYNAFGTGRFLTKAFMQYGWDIYAPDPKTRAIPYAVPMAASVEQLKGLPPALIQTAENCPLRDEGEAYGRKLSEAGVKVTSTRYNGMIHDFGLLNGINDTAAVKSSILQITTELKQYLK
ncbi:alpha/beta hydrolase [Mucilaginibacter angelicae]|uniref:Alpha/beta hydrolase n=1 Tax=Mucilaginibacter angelicae TaxID=869718 RepID=A0ABV6L461_9SPHI